MTRKYLVVVTVILATVLMLTGCNNASSPTDAVNRFRTAMNQLDFKQAFAYVAEYDDFGFSSGSEEIISAVAQTLDIEILGDSGTSDRSAVDVNITTIDLRDAYCTAASNIIPQYFSAAVSGQPISETEIGTRLVAEVVMIAQSGSAKGVTTRCSLDVVKNDRGKWEIVLNGTAFNAITGYLEEANNLISTGAITSQIYGNSQQTVPTQPVSPSDAS